MEPIIFVINDNEQNIDNFSQLYNEKLEKHVKINTKLFSNATTEKFYRYCVNSDSFTVDEFMQRFHIEDKDKFLKESQKEYELVKKQAFDNYKANNNLVLHFDFNELSNTNINKMREYIEMAKTIHGDKIQILVSEPENGFDKTSFSSLQELSHSVDLRFKENGKYGDYVTLPQVVEAYDLMKKELERILKLNLSPFEKLLFIHDFASNKIYKSECNMDASSSRTFINAMTTGDIVCVGYATIMQKFCEEVGISCEVIIGKVGEERDAEGHCANIVYIKDEKYGIDGYYFCDACWDSKKEGQIRKNYFYSALPLQDVKCVAQEKYFSEEFQSEKYPSISKPIPMSSFKRALGNIYLKSNDNVDEVALEQIIEQDLKFSKTIAIYGCKSGASNCFAPEHSLSKL